MCAFRQVKNKQFSNWGVKKMNQIKLGNQGCWTITIKVFKLLNENGRTRTKSFLYFYFLSFKNKNKEKMLIK